MDKELDIIRHYVEQNLELDSECKAELQQATEDLESRLATIEQRLAETERSIIRVVNWITRRMIQSADLDT